MNTSRFTEGRTTNLQQGVVEEEEEEKEKQHCYQYYTQNATGAGRSNKR